MSDIQKAIDALTAMRTCEKGECNGECSSCEHLEIQCKDLTFAYDAAIAAMQEKQHNDELRQQGRLVELPCAVGENIYQIVKTGSSEIHTIVHEGHEYSREVPYWGIWPCKFNLKLMDEFGKTVFLTHEAAQKALEKMRA